MGGVGTIGTGYDAITSNYQLPNSLPKSPLPSPLLVNTTPHAASPPATAARAAATSVASTRHAGVPIVASPTLRPSAAAWSPATPKRSPAPPPKSAHTFQNPLATTPVAPTHQVSYPVVAAPSAPINIATRHAAPSTSDLRSPALASLAKPKTCLPNLKGDAQRTAVCIVVQATVANGGQGS